MKTGYTAEQAAAILLSDTGLSRQALRAQFDIEETA